MRPLDEEWQDSGRNFDAENEGEVRARKSFNPNFTSENRVRSASPDGVKRPRRRVGEAPRYNVEESGDYSNNHQYRPNNNGYNNNAGYHDDNEGFEEFVEMLQQHNLEFIDGQIVKIF